MIINFLDLNQPSRPSEHRCAGERGRKQPRGTLLYVVVPELSKHQVGGTDCYLYGPDHHHIEAKTGLLVTCKCLGFAPSAEL